MFAGRWQALQKMLSVARSMAVISGVVLGADAGAVAWRPLVSNVSFGFSWPSKTS
jgi:hypothetical protein